MTLTIQNGSSRVSVECGPLCQNQYAKLWLPLARSKGWIREPLPNWPTPQKPSKSLHVCTLASETVKTEALKHHSPQDAFTADEAEQGQPDELDDPTIWWAITGAGKR